MRRFVPAAAGARLSEALFALSRPPAVRIPGEATTSMCGVIKDLKGECWIALDEEREVYVHELATLGSIPEILEPFITAGQLPADTVTELQALVDASRGTRIKVYGAFPQLFRDAALTHQQMIAAGRLPQPVIPHVER